jgi:protein-(glutamine-N5) methyltransferase, release factor-specific
MKETLSFIQTELQEFYSSDEIRNLSFRILESAGGMDRQSVLLGKDKQLSLNQKKQISQIVEDLKEYRPIQYILGETEFYGLRFELTGDVLIPRPETEELVEWISCWIKNHFPNNLIHILDIGTGSGCIAVTLAKKYPDAQVSALDFSIGVLNVASRNAKLNEVDIDLIRMDILKQKPEGCWDIIVSNPPYIVPSEKAAMLPNVLKHEPHAALFVPEEKPLLFYERIAELGLGSLSEEGALFFEINPLYVPELVEMLKQKGYRSVELKKDISGKDRMIKATL